VENGSTKYQIRLYIYILRCLKGLATVKYIKEMYVFWNIILAVLVRIPFICSSKLVSHICIARRKKHIQRLLRVAGDKSPPVLPHGASSAMN
jgi:hypothetical protein